jgi:hypothetical protein
MAKKMVIADDEVKGQLEEAAQEPMPEPKKEVSSESSDYENHPKFAKFKTKKDGE